MMFIFVSKQPNIHSSTVRLCSQCYEQNYQHTTYELWIVHNSLQTKPQIHALPAEPPPMPPPPPPII